MTSFTILNILYLAKDALKYSEDGPDLLSGHLFELGAGCEGLIRNKLLNGSVRSGAQNFGSWIRNPDPGCQIRSRGHKAPWLWSFA